MRTDSSTQSPRSGCSLSRYPGNQTLASSLLFSANEKVEDIHGSPQTQTQMIENVDACLRFLDNRGVNVQGLSAHGQLSILGLFFILSRYKQQQQYYQSLVELSQQTAGSAPSQGHAPPPDHAPSPASHLKTQEMQPGLAARYAGPPAHSGLGTPQKKNSRLPGPSRGPPAGSVAPRSPASSNLNRRSQSFNSIDKSKPLQYASGNDRDSVRVVPPGPMVGGVFPSVVSSSIPSPAGGKSWRSKSMNLKHSATSSMLGGPAPSPSQASDRLAKPQGSGGSGVTGRSMLEKFRMVHPRSSSSSVADMTLQEEDDVLECGDAPPPAPPTSSSTSRPSSNTKTSSCSSKGSASSGSSKAPPTGAGGGAAGRPKRAPPSGLPGGGADRQENPQSQSPDQHDLVQQHLRPQRDWGRRRRSGTFSENDCSMVVPVSPTKGELVYSRTGYSKTAKQCLQEISVSQQVAVSLEKLAAVSSITPHDAPIVAQAAAETASLMAVIVCPSRLLR
ncbi:hypothetical protein NHX12_020595 [Muraenolepis orangiensis]|uniref:Neuron navigator 3 n=1 Tax=Muraenolepis orangiensis TaxID=630683 RepID=A0A9Q0ESB2_9TELE|nr:hypothetical protein NHX12_020595 [Muraenolepis orangiensis]